MPCNCKNKCRGFTPKIKQSKSNYIFRKKKPNNNPCTISTSDSLKYRWYAYFPRKHGTIFSGFRTAFVSPLSVLLPLFNCLSPLRHKEAQQYNKNLPSDRNGLLDYSNLSSLPLGKDPSMAVSWFLEIGQYPISSFTQHHFTTAHNLQQGILSSDFRKLRAYHLSHATFLWCLERTL